MVEQGIPIWDKGIALPSPWSELGSGDFPIATDDLDWCLTLE